MTRGVPLRGVPVAIRPDTPYFFLKVAEGGYLMISPDVPPKVLKFETRSILRHIHQKLQNVAKCCFCCFLVAIQRWGGGGGVIIG